MVLTASNLRAMSDDHRYAILLLGLFLNEANWLRKLLVKAALNIGDDPEGQANFGLTALLATTLGGKIHEGWDRIANGRVGSILNVIGLPPELSQLRDSIAAALQTKTILRIRNNIAFHYPDRKFDFAKVAAHVDDADTVIYMVPEGYAGDVLSHVSTLAGIEPLLALNDAEDYHEALKNVWEELTDLSGNYCVFISEALATVLLTAVPNMLVEDVTILDAPEADEHPSRFFVHPPTDLDEMRRQVAEGIDAEDLDAGDADTKNS
jgi:hypothetical protein